MVGLGPEFKNALKMPGPWRMSLGGFGECLPNHGNYVEIEKGKVDAWGIPTLKIHCAWGENELTMSKDIAIQAAEILAAAGATEISPYQKPSPPGLGIHEMGTARMGRDPKTSVLNQFQQSHDVKNLFVVDGSAFVNASCQNPTWTIMSLCWRSCDYLADQFGKGNL